MNDAALAPGDALLYEYKGLTTRLGVYHRSRTNGIELVFCQKLSMRDAERITHVDLSTGGITSNLGVMNQRELTDRSLRLLKSVLEHPTLMPGEIKLTLRSTEGWDRLHGDAWRLYLINL